MSVGVALSTVVMSMLFDEVDARRKILRGRKAITRTYYKGNAIPAWGIVVLVAGGMIGVGIVLYVVLRMIVLKNDDPEEP
ncbi:hypothetical protein J437_LFUL001188 [Ladona fulva]|uniref:Transmembrane protein n=1 Tax=Ladona fulva TaxID=123851 RepID=A0A8K0JVW9_LADFU|nr:hypothetical protein J437_LFUL001188 [Ladona fulva]